RRRRQPDGAERFAPRREAHRLPHREVGALEARRAELEGPILSSAPVDGVHRQLAEARDLTREDVSADVEDLVARRALELGRRETQNLLAGIVRRDRLLLVQLGEAVR